MRSYSVTVKTYCKGGKLQEVFGASVVAPTIRSAVGKALRSLEKEYQNNGKNISIEKNLTINILASGRAKVHEERGAIFQGQLSLEETKV